jgi:uncharacterized membrane protein
VEGALMFPPRLFYIHCLLLVLAVAAATAIGRRWGEPRLSPRQGRLWTLALALLSAAYFALSNCLRWQRFEFGAVDLATISQTLWRLGQGLPPFESILGTHTLRVHFTLLWWPLSALFSLAPSIPWLLALSALFAAATAPLLYGLARSVGLSPWLSFARALSFLLDPYFQLGQIAAAHAEHFGMAATVGLLWAVQKKRWSAAVLLLPWVLATKEDSGLYVAALGAYACLGLSQWRAGLLLGAFGLGWSVAAYTLWMPAFGPDTQQLFARYAHLGATPGAALRNVVLHPGLLWQSLAQGAKVMEVFYLLAGLAFLPLFSGWALLPLAVAVLFKSASQHEGMYRFFDHYSLQVLPYLFFALILGLKRAVERGAGNWRLGWVLIVLALLVNFESADNPLGRQFKPQHLQLSEHHRRGAAILARIPPQATVLAQEDLAPHLSLRPELWAVTRENYAAPGHALVGQADWACFDLNAALEADLAAKVQSTVAYFKASPDYRLVADEDGWLLWARRTVQP